VGHTAERNDDLVRWRRDLHRIPELADSEEETAAYVEERLKQFGLDPRRLTPTGMVADIEGREGPGPTVVLRADMDGLPLDEDSGEPFSSTHPGRMHACGHDGHMAILLGTARRLLARDFAGTVRVLFQPAEERPPGGALGLIEAGALEGARAVLGLHLQAGWPVGWVGLKPGPLMAYSDRFEIRIKGRGGHGSEPQNAQDAVVIAAEMVMSLQTIVSRAVPPGETVVVTCGTIAAGQTFNIIAETADITGTVRTFDRGVQADVEAQMRRRVEHIAAIYGASAELTYMPGYPAVINDPGVVAEWAAAIRDLAAIEEPRPLAQGEDFAYYLHHVPGAFLWLGAAPSGGIYPHHSPHFRISEAALPLGVQVMERGARHFLAHPPAPKAG
jgi:amidohydrolase